MATADQYVAVLESWVGMSEAPPRSNQTPIGVEFGWNGVPWCCETCSVAQARVGLHCFHTASVYDAIQRAKRGENGMQWVPRDGVIRRGDMATFDWAGHGNPNDFHISSVVDPGTQAKFQTIGGNENDAVTKQWRDRTYIQGFIRLPFDNAPGGDRFMPALTDAEQKELLENTRFIRAVIANDDGAIRDIQSRVGNVIVPDLDELKAHEQPIQPKNPPTT